MKEFEGIETEISSITLITSKDYMILTLGSVATFTLNRLDPTALIVEEECDRYYNESYNKAEVANIIYTLNIFYELMEEKGEVISPPFD